MNIFQVNKKTDLFILTLLFFLFSSTAGALAQAGRGGINGLVSDPSGAVIPGAKVTVVNHATGVSQSTITTSAGLYSFVSLNPGSYQVSASLQGFETTSHDKVTVSVDQVTAVNIALKVGSVSEVVTVASSVDLVDTNNSTVGQLIGAETIDRVPLFSRNVYDLVQLSAGVTPSNGSPNSADGAMVNSIANGRPGVDVSSYSINGAILGSVYYMLDGSPLGIAENNIAAIIPMSEIPEDAVDEYRVETQNTPASYQSGAAGVISLVSKSGGDKFHGDAFGVFRPDVLAANDYFNKQNQLANGQPNSPPSFHRYQEGGAISGPILRKKLFFFGDYEATQQASFDSGTFSVPTTAERTGDFSADSYTIYDPTQPDVTAGSLAGTRQPMAGNKIANANPIALKYLSELPHCNYPSSSTCEGLGTLSPFGDQNNLYVPGVDPSTGQKFDVRIDFYKSEMQKFFGRFSFSRTTEATVNAFGNMFDPYYAQNITNARNVMAGDDITLNPTTVLQLRGSFTRHYENQGGDPRQNGTDITALGFPSSLAQQEVYKILPLMNFDDFGGMLGGTCCYNTFVFASEDADGIASLTKMWGKHELSAGVEYMKRFLNAGQPPYPSGNYSFDTSATDQASAAATPVGGNDFASFLIGMGTAPGNESGNGPNFTKDLFIAESSPYYAGFLQDTYHASHGLTLTAGVRWDIFGGKTERHNRLEYFNPTAAATVSGVPFTGGEVFSNGGNRSPFTTNLSDFSPRLGFAWQPEKRFVIHAGAGIYYGPSAEMVSAASEDSDGFSSVTNWSATCLNADGNTTYNGTSGCIGAAAGAPAPSSTGIYSLSNPFPGGVVPLVGASQGLGTYLGSTLNTMLHSQRTQATYNFNIGWEYEFPHGVVLSAGYVGSRGLFLPLGEVDLNQLPLSVIASNNYALCVDTSNPACVTVPNQWQAIQPASNNNAGSPTVPLWVSLQEFPQFGNGTYGSGNGIIVHGYPGGDSEYSSLQTKLEKRLTQHFTTLASFTWSKLMTDDGNPPLGFVGFHAGLPQDWKNINLEHSVSPQDVKLQFTWQASYDLPIGKGRALNLAGPGNAILGGWTTNAVAYLSDGVPIVSPVVGAPVSYFNQRLNLVCNPRTGAAHTAAAWFNPNCFQAPASQFVAGTAPAYLAGVRTMGAQDLDLSLFKNFHIGGERVLRFEISSYNVANKAQFSAPTVSSSASGFSQFGLIQTDSNTPRQFQFASRYTF